MDCKIAKNYLTERKRMCNMYVQRNCKGCVYHTTDGCWRTTMEHNNPEKAIEIAQKWSNEHPQKTYLTDFLDKHPNAPLANGIPSGICPYYLGYMTKKEFNECSTNCQKCWNTPIKGSEETYD